MFQKKTWKDGEVISAPDLNRIEDRIENCSEEIDISTDEYNASTIKILSVGEFKLEDNPTIALVYHPDYQGTVDSDYSVPFSISQIRSSFNLPQDYEFSSNSLVVNAFAEIPVGRTNVYSPLSYSSETKNWVSLANHASTVGYCLYIDRYGDFSTINFVADSYHLSEIKSIRLSVDSLTLLSSFFSDINSDQEFLRMVFSLELPATAGEYFASSGVSGQYITYVPITLSGWEAFVKMNSQGYSALSDEEIDSLLLGWGIATQEDLSEVREEFKQVDESEIKSNFYNTLDNLLKRGTVEEISNSSLSVKKLEPKLERDNRNGSTYESISFYRPPVLKDYQGSSIEEAGLNIEVQSQIPFFFKEKIDETRVVSSVGSFLSEPEGNDVISFIGCFWDTEQNSVKEWKGFFVSRNYDEWSYQDENLKLSGRIYKGYPNKESLSSIYDEVMVFSSSANTSDYPFRLYGGLIRTKALESVYDPPFTFEEPNKYDSKKYFNISLKKDLSTGETHYLVASEREQYFSEFYFSNAHYTFSTLELMDIMNNSPKGLEELQQFFLEKGKYITIEKTNQE